MGRFSAAVRLWWMKLEIRRKSLDKQRCGYKAALSRMAYKLLNCVSGLLLPGVSGGFPSCLCFTLNVLLLMAWLRAFMVLHAMF